MTPTQRKNRIALIAALRSGKYHQARSVLVRAVGKELHHCCLGVACDLAGIPMESRTDGCRVSNRVFRFAQFGVQDTQPPNVWWARRFGADLNPNELSDMNDGGKSFAKIADYIESKL